MNVNKGKWKFVTVGNKTFQYKDGKLMQIIKWE